MISSFSLRLSRREAQELFAAQTNGVGIRTTCSVCSQGLARPRHLAERPSPYRKIHLMLLWSCIILSPRAGVISSESEQERGLRGQRQGYSPTMLGTPVPIGERWTAHIGDMRTDTFGLDTCSQLAVEPSMVPGR